MASATVASPNTRADRVAGLAGPDGDADGQVGLAGARRAQEQGDLNGA